MWSDAGVASRAEWRGGLKWRVIANTKTSVKFWRRGFTLIEILLALALLGLLSAAFVSVASNLSASRPKAPEDVFWEATRLARRTALASQSEVQLRFDAKEKAFVVEGAKTTETFPVTVANQRDLTIDLLQAQSSGGSILIGGQLLDTQTILSVSFYPDGTCTPFRLQIRTTGPARVVGIDPWTCAPVLPEPKKT
jgi:prepilin-type N-terminal cleavage/methylation domain-containing protein